MISILQDRIKKLEVEAFMMKKFKDEAEKYRAESEKYQTQVKILLTKLNSIVEAQGGKNSRNSTRPSSKNDSRSSPSE